MKIVGVAYCALGESKRRKETVILLRDVQIKSAHGLILIDKLGLSHIRKCLPPPNLEKGQCF